MRRSGVFNQVQRRHNDNKPDQILATLIIQDCGDDNNVVSCRYLGDISDEVTR